MRVLAACSLGGAGHLRPLDPFLRAASASGHEVLVVGPPDLERMVVEAGHPFRAGGAPPEAQIAPIREQLPVAPPSEASVLANRELFGRLATTAMLPSMDAAVREWRPDVIVRDPCEYASAVVAEGAGIPVAQVAISLAEVESGALEWARPALEVHGRDLTDAIVRSPYLTRFPPSLDPSPFPSTTRVRPVEPDDATAPSLPDWWAGRKGPLVYVTFGTVLGYMSSAPRVFRTALRAVSDLDARVLLTTGNRLDPDALGAVPEHVHVEPWVDQRRVMGNADVVVCHGGSGTVLGALSAGVPVVCVPVFADQFENARRVATAEAGRVAPADEVADAAGTEARRPVGEEDAPAIALALEAVLRDPAYRHRAEEMAEEMSRATPVEEVLEQLLTLAPDPTRPRRKRQSPAE